MSAGGIPEGARRFLLQHIDSVEQLEVLLFLRAHPEQAWSAEEVARELRINADSAGTRLEDLAGRSLLTRCEAGRCRWSPATPELARDVDELARAYAERRVSVINLIFSKPSERIRTFADAFKFNKKGDD